MRGVGYTPVRRPARALLAGAAFLAGSLGSSGALHAQQTPEETAFANPQIHGGSLGGADLPQPLTPSDANGLRQVFRLQSTGHVGEAAAVMANVRSPLLTGHVLAERYLSRYTMPSSSELASWLAQYPDHPDAPAVHALLLTRLKPGTPKPPEPSVACLGPAAPATPSPEESAVGLSSIVRNPLLDRTVKARAREGATDSALRLLTRTKGLDAIYGGQLRAEIAQALFTQGQDESALRIAEGALHQSGGRIGLAGFVGGLAAWRLDRPADAQRLFEAASQAEVVSASTRAAAAFWAARAHMRNRDFSGFAPWMRRAATARHTFYGLIARRTLGLSTAFDNVRDTLSLADGEAVLATPHGERALALIQIGETRRAEAELRCLWPQVAADAGLRGAVMRVAEAAGLMDLAVQLADLIETAEGQVHDDVRFPLPRLHPYGGFVIDPALVYALTRIESNFDATAHSGMGARGLMQLMPETATYIENGGGIRIGGSLQNPAFNLALGQRYVAYLSKLDGVNGDLIRLLGSYNAGPTSFARMDTAIPATNDPLLFIESIPNDETRAFVARVLTYSWIYAARLRLPSQSLDALADGDWPRFGEQTERRDVVARIH